MTIPQTQFPKTGVFEDSELLQSVVLTIIQDLIYAQNYPLDAEERELLNRMVLMIQNPNTSREDWTNLKDETLYLVGSSISSFICHATSGFRTPMVGASALHCAAEDLICYASRWQGGGKVAQNFLRSLFKRVYMEKIHE